MACGDWCLISQRLSLLDEWAPFPLEQPEPLRTDGYAAPCIQHHSSPQISLTKPCAGSTICARTFYRRFSRGLIKMKKGIGHPKLRSSSESRGGRALGGSAANDGVSFLSQAGCPDRWTGDFTKRPRARARRSILRPDGRRQGVQRTVARGGWAGLAQDHWRLLP